MRYKQKKGLSTIAGAIFTAAIIVGGLNATMYLLDQNASFNQSILEKSVNEVNTLNEKFALMDARIDNNKFNLTLLNTGNVAVNATRLWVTNSTAVPEWYNVYNLTTTIGPGQTAKDIGQSLPVVAKNSSSYMLKVVTDRGNTAVARLLSTSSIALKLNLFTVPRSIPTGQNVTLLFALTNNATDGSIMQSIKPALSWTKTEAPSGTTNATATLMEGPTPTEYKTLRPAETAFFKWVYKVVGDDDDAIKFNATIVNAKQGNYLTEKINVVIDTFAEQSNTALQSLGITIGSPDTSGKLHLHGETAPSIGGLGSDLKTYRLDPTLPDNPGNNNNIFDTAGENWVWVSANTTETIQIASGKWNHTIYGAKSAPSGGTASITVKVEKVGQNGLPLIPPVIIWDTHQINATTTTVTAFYMEKNNVAAVTLNPQERIRVTITWVATSAGFQLYYDQTSKDSLLFSPTQTPRIPSFQVYSGGGLKLSIQNSGTTSIYIDNGSRAVMQKSITNATYGALVTGWTNETAGAAPNSGAIDSTKDSPRLLPGKILKIEFNDPVKIPGMPSGANNPSITSNPGSYDAYIRISGYDDNGGFVLRVIIVGIVVVP